MKKPGLLLSLVPVLALIALLMIGVSIFGDELTSGPSQLAIFSAAVLTALIGLYALKVPWARFEESVGNNLKSTSAAIIILLSIGALTATWMLSGIVPTMIWYGLKLIHPRIFIVLTFLLCAVVSLLAGSSWTTVGTIGVALFGAGTFIGIPTGWLAGAIISGAYLGDKVSPLSDTTNLSASIAGVNLYTHVRYTLLTTLPALVICLAVYGIVGATVPVSSGVQIDQQLAVLKDTFHISPWFLLVPCLTIYMIFKKVPAMVTLFLSALAGVTDPEGKRKIIGRLFVETFEKYAGKIENARWLAQGTIYPDVIESAGIPGIASKIKSHHNVGGLPEKMHLKIVEPLRMLFKDEVRRVGRALGIKDDLVGRHPFPGPSLAIRIIGDVTREKLDVLREADDIFIRGLRSYDCSKLDFPSAADPSRKADNLYDAIWQAGVILLPIKSVGVMGDERTYKNAVALRAVSSTDGMTADWFHFPYDFLSKVSEEIINKVQGVNRVVYDISSKPPSTIEWE